MTLDRIIFTSSAADTLQVILEQENYSKTAVIVDENTFQHCYPLLQDQLPEHVVIRTRSGEIHKTLETCSHIWQELTDHHFDRKSLVINLGGGVIGDMGGFCASTFKRGIDFINVPTTLLAQVDASVGGKLGIDFNGLKNHIGVFNLPKNILIDLRFLDTLPKRELRSGFGEIIKHHLIADGSGWQRLRQNSLKSMNWPELVPHSVQIKYNIVEEDPVEKGIRKSLNFGHTIGHAVESYLLNTGRSILHGEAIALGMICEAYISYRHQLLSKQELDEIATFILVVYDKILLDDKDHGEITGYLVQDKKNRSNNILAALLSGIGKSVWDHPITSDETLEALVYYHQL